MSVLEANNISFRYEKSDKAQLSDLNFSMEEGEIVFISGRSGTGKSTFLNIINGIIPEIIEGEFSGKLLIKGKEDLKIYERNIYIGNVLQNPRSQFFTTNTTSELVFEMENYGISPTEMRRKLAEVTEEYEIEYLLDREILNISSGERQLLALVSSLIMEPDVVIFDEPSANLDYGNSMRLRDQIIELRKNGKTVIVADHRCFYLSGIVDKVLLLKDGSITQFDSEEEFCRSGYEYRSFDLFSETYKKRIIKRSGETVIAVNGLYYKHILKNVNVDFKKNEVTAIVGLNGAGKTTLARLMSGVIKPDKGKIELDSRPLYIMQDADFQLFGASCMKELEISSKNVSENARALELMGIGHLADIHPHSLSGGEKQRLQMAIAMVSPNDVIILDEPTSGLDAVSMHGVIEMIDSLRSDSSLIFISHDYEFIRQCADRIIYLNDGHIEDDFYMDDENVEKLDRLYRQMEKKYEK